MWLHQPVLTKEFLTLADLKSGEDAIDATVGGGGHALEILKATSPSGKLLALDTDQKSLDIASINLKPYKGRVTFINDNFTNLSAIMKKQKNFKAKLILADLGPAMWHLTENEYGGSIMSDSLLDMRRSETGPSAAEILRTFSAEKLAKLFLVYGEEKLAGEIANFIYQDRKKVKQLTTGWLANLVAYVYKKHRVRQKNQPATKVFQALRIYVNRELDNLADFLPQALAAATLSGRVAIISFHSLEDRLIKNYFRNLARAKAVKILTKHAFQASYMEQRKNPSSRSAKLRVAEKINSTFVFPKAELACSL